MATDFKTRLERLETAQAIGAQGVVILFPREKTNGKILALRRKLGLSDDYPLGVKIVRVNFA